MPEKAVMLALFVMEISVPSESVKSRGILTCQELDRVDSVLDALGFLPGTGLSVRSLLCNRQHQARRFDLLEESKLVETFRPPSFVLKGPEISHYPLPKVARPW